LIILLRTCGGLGNQIFQLFFARLIAEKYNTSCIFHYHESNYSRVTSWEYPKIFDLLPCDYFEKLILKLRLPQILYRLGFNTNEYFKIGPYLILDGYFQNYESYKIFDHESINTQLKVLKKELQHRTNPFKKGLNIYHFRLGDFFYSEESQQKFVLNEIDSLLPGSTIISNRDDLFLGDRNLINRLNKKNANYLVTKEMTSIDLICLFSCFRVVYSNGSTLAFWASLLFNTKYMILGTNKELSPHEHKLLLFRDFIYLKNQ
jgi:hypothetical protein